MFTAKVITLRAPEAGGIGFGRGPLATLAGAWFSRNGSAEGPQGRFEKAGVKAGRRQCWFRVAQVTEKRIPPYMEQQEVAPPKDGLRVAGEESASAEITGVQP